MRTQLRPHAAAGCRSHRDQHAPPQKDELTNPIKKSNKMITYANGPTAMPTKAFKTTREERLTALFGAVRERER